MMRRAALHIAAALLAVAALLAAGACLVYPPAYVWRVLVWQDADADDLRRFPARPVRPRPDATPLPRNPQPQAVEAAWQAAGGSLPMDADLARLGTRAFLVLRGTEVIHEAYFDGHDRTSLVTSFSVAKSFLSALVGIAVAEGRIASLDDPVTRYLPELGRRDPRFAAVTLRHLLRMASGLRYEEFPFLQGDDTKTYYHPDLRRLALEETQVRQAPGLAFHYNNYHPLLLGLVLERATGMPVAAWLESRLWQPAGMAGEASWSLDSAASGFEKMESGLNARAEDFARFGALMLREGQAGGRQVVPRDWAIASTRPDAGPPAAGYYAGSPWVARRPGRYYAAFWWGEQREGGPPDFAAMGNHGQVIFVSPRNDVVIVRNGERHGLGPGRWFDRAQAMADRLGAGRAAR